MNNTTFTPQEIRALKKIIDFTIYNQWEDVVDVIMKSGAFRELANDDEAVIELARKLTDHECINELRRTTR